MFSSVLVANRGEIAVRILRTLRRMGIRGVVACSIPDRLGLAVRTADAHVLLDGYSAAESYLAIDAIIAAARKSGCEAIHPGYGFLSERAEFAERCAAEGLVFIVPPPAVLRGIGDKSAARRLATQNGVPVVPGWDGDDDEHTLLRQATRIGFPVMIKARGGGGGRGMREVHDPNLFLEAADSARREAHSAFGDAGLLIEKLVTNAHHVEVQVLADAHGNVIHLGERDCSVQRRHQKLIEETPSPVVDDALRNEVTGAALRLARSIGYVNAGTFEFLVGEPDGSGRRPFFFLEVNPRLQVEHPVTELVTGLDLVELQLLVAAGEPLPLRQEDIPFAGHAIEFRVNAEDPWDDFRPAAGRIRGESLSSLPDRVDAGFETGDVVPTEYDSLLAKLIIRGAGRAETLEIAANALDRSTVDGIHTNLGLHRAVLASPGFQSGAASVDWLEQHLGDLLEHGRTPAPVFAAAAIGLGIGRSHDRLSLPAWIGGDHSGAWLNDGNECRFVGIRQTGNAEIEAVVGESRVALRLTRRSPGGITLLREDGAGELAVLPDLGDPGSVTVVRPGEGAQTWRLWLSPPPPLARRAHAAAEGSTHITAPLAGTIVAVPVEEGHAVAAGDLLVILEAMKMEHRITATSAGIVKRVAVRVRDVVREGDALVEMA